MSQANPTRFQKPVKGSGPEPANFPGDRRHLPLPRDSNSKAQSVRARPRVRVIAAPPEAPRISQRVLTRAMPTSDRAAKRTASKVEVCMERLCWSHDSHPAPMTAARPSESAAKDNLVCKSECRSLKTRKAVWHVARPRKTA